MTVKYVKYKRTKAKPAVGLPMPLEYNETVAVDLHELVPSVWHLYIIIGKHCENKEVIRNGQLLHSHLD